MAEESTAIRYDLDMDDLMAFQTYYFATSPTIRRRVAIQTWGGAAGVLVVALLLFAIRSPGGITLPKVIAALIGSAVYALYIKWAIRRSAAKLFRRMLAEGANKTVIGWHELEAIPAGLIERSAVNESKTAWAGVEKLASTDDHVFIFVGAAQAHVVPKKKIDSGNLSAFLSAVGAHFDPNATLNAVTGKTIGELPRA